MRCRAWVWSRGRGLGLAGYLSGEYGRIEGEIIGRGFAICDWRYLQKVVLQMDVGIDIPC